MALILVLFIVVLRYHQSSGVIYRLNESEHARMPAVFHLEPYAPCVLRGGEYCHVTFRLVPDAATDLHLMIREYSAHRISHYDHTNLQYGVCLTKCKHILNTNREVDRVEILEGCLNETLSRDYGMKAKISKPVKCMKSDEKIEIDKVDVLVGGICIALLVINIIGSFYEFYCVKKKNEDSSILTCFAVQRNWNRLVAPADLDPRLRGLKSFCGMRTMSSLVVISVHSILPFALSTNNPYYIEEALHKKLYQVIVNLSPIVQNFFIMSGFLLIFNLQRDAEKDSITWTALPRRVILRWLRLTPPYAIVLAITCTWLRFAGPGPLWQRLAGYEIAACRSKWWQNMLYLNNYDDDDSQCMPQTWYIAADLQLHFVGLVVGVLTKGRARVLMLALLFLAGLVTPAVHTYYQDLDGVLILSPEAIRHSFAKDPTFNNVYKRGHTNVACFVIGISLSLLVYHWQKMEFSPQKYLKYRYIYWSLAPTALAVMYSGSVFYWDGPPASIHLRVMFAALHKPVFGCLVAAIVLGMVFKFENSYRSILEWHGWTLPSRLSYCAYLVHVLVIRTLAGTRTALHYTSAIHIIESAVATIVISYVMAIPLALLVEAPFNQVVKMLTAPGKTTRNYTALQDQDVTINNKIK